MCLSSLQPVRSKSVEADLGGFHEVCEIPLFQNPFILQLANAVSNV